MTDRRRALAIGLAAVALVAAVVALGVRPKLQEAERLDAQVAARAERQAALETAVRGLQAAERAEPQLRRELRRLERALPGGARAAALLRQLDAASRGAVRLDATTLKAAGGSGAAGGPGALPPGATTGPSGTPGLTLTAGYTGPFQRVRHLVDDLHDAVRATERGLHLGGRLLSVDGLLLERDAEGGPLEATLALTAHVAPVVTASPAASPASGTRPAGGGTAPTAVAAAATP